MVSERISKDYGARRAATNQKVRRVAQQAFGVLVGLGLVTLISAALAVPAQAFAHTCTDDRSITYIWDNGTPDIAGDGERQAVIEGMKAWSRVADVDFRPWSINTSLDTTISWAAGNHGDGAAFDGPGGVRAHTFSPCASSFDGDMHFDEAETWTTGTGTVFDQPIDLVSVAMHESGHALGLLHSNDQTALMRDGYNPTRRNLGWDDIAGVQHLYGRDEGVYHLRNSNTDGAPDVSFSYYGRGDRPVTGDWNGDGIDTIGVYRPSNRGFYLRNTNDHGGGSSFDWGNPGDRPVIGDWDGNGTDTVSVYRPSTATFWLNNQNDGVADISFSYGTPEDIPIAGDWNEDGIDTIGLYRPSNSTFYLRNANSAGSADVIAAHGIANDVPVVGDWNSSGTDTIGVYRPSTGVFYLRNTNSAGSADLIILYGKAPFSGVLVEDTLPVAGDWDGNGSPTIGLFQY